MRKKALLAIAFAGGLVGPLLPAVESASVGPKYSAITQYEQSSKGTPEAKAYYLLGMVFRYLAGASVDTVENQYCHAERGLSGSVPGKLGWDFCMECLATQASGQIRRYVPAQTEMEQSTPEKLSGEELEFANRALAAALKQLEKSQDQQAKLGLTAIAAKLYGRLDDKVEEARCNKIVEQALETIEKSPNLTVAQAQAAISALNIKSSIVIPLETLNNRYTPGIKSCSMSDFNSCEKWKLRGLAIADKLPPTEHVRRKAHRDLALWYMTLDRNEHAAREKQILYSLVGFEDEKVLYPQEEGCGDLVWWRQEQKPPEYGCGMG